jgi:hypothetical protein
MVSKKSRSRAQQDAIVAELRALNRDPDPNKCGCHHYRVLQRDESLEIRVSAAVVGSHLDDALAVSLRNLPAVRLRWRQGGIWGHAGSQST